MFHSLNHAVDHLAFFIDIIVIDKINFRFTDFLHNHLFSKLCGNASVILQNLLDENLLADMDVIGKCRSVFQADLLIRIINFFDHCFFKINFNFSSGLIELTLQFFDSRISLSHGNFDRSL